MTAKTLSIYLAGPDVFSPDSDKIGNALKEACAALNLEGLYPMDNELEAGLEGRAAAQRISELNEAMIRRCDVLMANLNPFRGHEPDSGTAYEVGFAAALGKPVWGYLSDGRGLVQKSSAGLDPGGGAPRWVDEEGWTVEDFGLPVNLMIGARARIVVGDAFACLRAIAQAYQTIV